MKNYPLYEVTTIHNLRDVIKNRIALYPNTPVFQEKKTKGGEYVDIMPKQYDADIDALGTYFRSIEDQGARVAILAETRYEWYVTYLATTNGTGCIVPLDKELQTNEIKSMLNRAEVDILVFSKSKIDVVNEIYGNTDTVKHYICMDETSNENYLYFYDCINKGNELLASGDKKFIEATIDPEEMTILLFTSGTTAQSKAVMLNQKNICKNLMSMFSMLYIEPEKDKFMSVLPLHHTYECTCGFLGQVYRGTTVAICEGLRYITTNVKECKPTVILMVPAMIEMFYKAINKKLNSDPKMLKKFKFGRKLSNILLKVGIDVRKKLFAQIHETFGGNLRLLIVGGAPIDPEILQFFIDIGILAVQGYGLTECAPILALNRDKFRKNHAAGIALPGCDIKIDNPDEDGIGEFIAYGDNIFMGYYKNEEATKDAFTENGYYRTGDLGIIDEDGFCVITGRKKNVIIAKNGKNVFPEEIEYLLNLSPYVQESVIKGEHDERKDDILIVANIFPNKEEVEAKLGANPAPEKVQELIEGVVSEVNEKLVNYKKIKKTVVRETEFEKNTSRKIKRF